MRIKSFFLCLATLAGLSGNLPAAEAPAPDKLHLTDVDRLVGERNRALIASRRAVSAAEAGVDSAAARPNPALSLNTSGINSQRRSGSGSTNVDTILRLDQPIELGGKRGLRLGVAGALLDASRSDTQDSLRQQSLLARQAYFDLKASEDKARLSADSATLAGQLLSKAELRLKAGDLSPTDVARIRTDTLRAESDASQAEVDRQRARLALAQLLAVEAEAPRLATVDDWPALTPLPAVQADSDNRPDVVAARQRLEAATKAVDLAKSLQVRDVTVGAQIERTAQERGDNLIGVGISVPLFTGYDFRGEIRRAYVDRDSAQDELERIKANADAESNQFVFEANRLSERARRLRDEALPAARKASQAVQFAFSQGAASVLDVIDARRSLHAVEIDTANALADAAKARAAWAAAMNRQELP
jgi:cobalt-zinc-cadmium efflux system outer membrane protein